MCVIDTKTYVSPDGIRRAFDSIRPCHNATSTRLCRNIERRSSELARIVEVAPSDDHEDDLIVTQGKDGRGRVYRDLSRRITHGTTLRRSSTTKHQSPLASPISPSFSDFRPPAPTPPPAARYPPPQFCPMMSGALEPGQAIPHFDIANDYIYDVPPLFQPQDRRPSLSSTSADLGEVDTTTVKRRERKRVTIHIPTRSGQSSPTISSPGLSHPPRLSQHIRHDSAKEISMRKSSSDDEYSRRDIDGNRVPRSHYRREELARQEADAAEQRRLAQLEQNRYRARDEARRESTAAARDASNERRRRARAASDAARRTAERVQRSEADRDHDRDRRIQGERRAAKRESLDADARRSRERERQLEQERQRQIEGERELDRQLRRRDSLRRRNRDRDQDPPLSPRAAAPHGVPAVHNHGDPLRARGSDVIAREQARLTREELHAAMGRTVGLDGRYAEDAAILNDEYEPGGRLGEVVVVAEDLARRDRMRRYRDDRRRPAERDFWS